MKRLLSLFTIACIFLTFFVGAATAQPNPSTALNGYSYGMNQQKISDVSVALTSTEFKKQELSGQAILYTPQETITIDFQGLKAEKDDFTGFGTAHTSNGDKTASVALDKNLKRIAGSIDYDGTPYSFVAGQGIISPADLKAEYDTLAAKASQTISPMGIVGLMDVTSNAVRLQLSGPNSVSRTDPTQVYQIWVHQYWTTNNAFSVQYVKAWINPPRYSNQGFSIVGANPTSSSGPVSFSISIALFGLSIPATVSSINESHNQTLGQWTLYNPGAASAIYNTGIAVESYMNTISDPAGGTYNCTGYASAEVQFYDTVGHYYITNNSGSHPYYVTVH